MESGWELDRRMPVEIIAEIANAHQGDPRMAATLAERAFAAGADAVKFQVYFADELLVERHPRFAHFRDQAFDVETWAEVIPAAAEQGPVYCDVFGPRALATALAHGTAGVKVHSSDTSNMTLLHRVADTGCRVFLSAGGTTVRELQRAIDVFAGGDTRPVLLHGFQSYPTQIESSNLARLAWLGENFDNVADIGYADHVSGDDPFAFILPAMALVYGIRVIEKHVTWDRSAQGVDYFSSIDVETLGAFVETIRQAESAIGNISSHFVPSEQTYRDSIKKHFVSASDLPAGHVLEAKDMDMKRVPDVTGDAIALEMLTGRELLHDVPLEHRLTRSDVACRVWALPVARSGSSRLPGKALLEVAGMPALGHMFERLKRIEIIDQIVFCTTNLDEDDALADLAAQHLIPCYRGPVDDVLARMLGAMTDGDADIVLRVTGDDILIDRDYVARAVAHHLHSNAEYTDLKALPSGTEVEVFDADLLRDIGRMRYNGDETEYLTNYVTENADQFCIAHAPVDPHHARDWRLTLDTSEDYVVICKLLEAMRANGKAMEYDMDDIVEFFEAHPEILDINAGVRQRQRPISVETRLDWGRLTGP